MQEEFKGVPEVFTVDFVGCRSDNKTAKCSDDDCEWTGDTLTEERCVWGFSITSPIYFIILASRCLDGAKDSPDCPTIPPDQRPKIA